MRQSEAHRAAWGLAQEIESLEKMRQDVVQIKPASRRILGEIKAWSTTGIRVHIPRATALRLLSEEIASKRKALSDLKKEAGW